MLSACSSDGQVFKGTEREWPEVAWEGVDDAKLRPRDHTADDGRHATHVRVSAPTRTSSGAVFSGDMRDWTQTTFVGQRFAAV